MTATAPSPNLPYNDDLKTMSIFINIWCMKILNVLSTPNIFDLVF